MVKTNQVILKGYIQYLNKLFSYRPKIAVLYELIWTDNCAELAPFNFVSLENTVLVLYCGRNVSAIT